jgi:hypothetical protein
MGPAPPLGAAERVLVKELPSGVPSDPIADLTARSIQWATRAIDARRDFLFPEENGTVKNTRQQHFVSSLRSRIFLAAAVVMTTGSLALGPARQSLAQGSKSQPMAVVTFSGYDQLIADVNYIGGLINKDGLSQIIEGYLAAVTGGAGLNGMDKTKPWGLIVQTDGRSLAGGYFTNLAGQAHSRLGRLLNVSSRISL